MTSFDDIDYDNQSMQCSVPVLSRIFRGWPFACLPPSIRWIVATYIFRNYLLFLTLPVSFVSILTFQWANLSTARSGIFSPFPNGSHGIGKQPLMMGLLLLPGTESTLF